MHLQYVAFVFIFLTVGCQGFYPNEHKLTEFLKSLFGAIQTRTGPSIGSLMTSSFAYHSCRRVFSKEETIERLVHLPLNRYINFNIGQIDDWGTEILVDIAVSGLGSAPINITLYVDVKGNSALLVLAKQFSCHRRPRLVLNLFH